MPTQVTIAIDRVELRRQYNWLILQANRDPLMPIAEELLGLINMVEAMLDIAELGEQL